MVDEACLRRMEWRCRRGMLELDLMFTPFVSEHLPRLNAAQIVALDTLLDLPDNVLWELLANGGSNQSDSNQSDSNQSDSNQSDSNQSGSNQHDAATQAVIRMLN